jgi:acetoin utilization deacetylase AcuC-like enzyme
MKFCTGRDGKSLIAYYSDHFPIPLPPDHRFPIDKYRLLRESIIAEHIIPQDDLRVPDFATRELICLAHDPVYVDKIFAGKLSEKEIRRIGFPWSPELVVRSQRSVGGTIAACRSALESGVSANLAGGTHHAHRDFGSGYCLLNDCAVAIKVIQGEKLAENVIILDCDVHQGDGTASIFSGDPRVFTFSIHGARNFPFHKVPGDLDIELEDGTGDADYLDALQNGIHQALASFEPDLVVYLAGADPYQGDRLGRLALTMEGLSSRDELVFNTAKQAGVPVAIVMSGGYARNIADTASIHLETIRQAANLAPSPTRTGYAD